MSKTHVYTLIATALLGILLFLVVRIAGDMEARITADAEPIPVFIHETGLPRIKGPAELNPFIESHDIDADIAIAASAEWRSAHGFLDRYELFGITEQAAPARAYDDLDDDELAARSAQGDLGATQALAARIATTDPVAAMSLYETAAAQGSAFAMVRIGSLRDTIADMMREDIRDDTGFRARLGELDAGEPTRTMHMAAFAYVAAAIRDGGIAFVDHDLLAWTARMAESFSPEREAAACAYSAQLFVKLSVARRGQGLAPITTEAPPVFAAVPDLFQKLPCRTTPNPIIQLLDLGECSIEAVEITRGETTDLYICSH